MAAPLIALEKLRKVYTRGRLVRSLKGSVTLVIIEHDMQFLFSLADEISVIHWGQVIARGTPTELKQNPWVQSSNLGRLN